MGQKTKILLINPPLTGSFSAGIFTIKVPLGLAYIAAYLEKQGHKPEILDCMAYYEEVEKQENGSYRIGLSEKEIIKKIKNFNPDIVGVSCSFSIYEKDSTRIARLVKQNSEALVVFGGAHSSANPDSVLKNKEVDMIVKGEGEVVFSNIAKSFKDKKKKSSIPGTIIRNNYNKIKINKPAEFIKNLDEIPFPARHLLPMEKYLSHPQNSIANMKGPTTEIITSRGCPFNCIFCSIHTVWGRKWRARSAKNVVDELEHLYQKYGIKEFRFFDDNLTWDKKRIIEICDEIIKRKLNIKWDTPNGVVIATLNEEVLRKMKRAGYYKIIMGIESGSEKTLKFMRKPISLKHAKKIISLCNKIGIWTWSTFVIGFPDETKEEIQKTIDFAKKSGLNFATFYIAQPYPGTEMYDIYEKKGLLKGGIKSTSSVTNTKYDTAQFSAKELDNLQKKAYSDFIKYRLISYLNPIKFYREFLNRIRNIEDLIYVLRMFKNLVKQEYSPIYKKEK
ncbi:radical SAM protein [Candidatus Pacearchaeota archaeon]|nr:radical SAM protein [Candidatus Pacearchaeota archaeon]